MTLDDRIAILAARQDLTSRALGEELAKELEMTETVADSLSIEECPDCDGEGYKGYAPSPSNWVDTSELCDTCKGSRWVFMDAEGHVIGPARQHPLVVSHVPPPF